MDDLLTISQSVGMILKLTAEVSVRLVRVNTIKTIYYRHEQCNQQTQNKLMVYLPKEC